MPLGISLEPASVISLDRWAALRAQLWADASVAEHREEVRDVLDQTKADRAFVRLALAGDKALGFVEASVRQDHVNGCDTSPVAFLEGIYVEPAWRHRGIARALLAAVEAWARANGLTELASDADIENPAGHAFHAAAGFEETERVVFFRKPL